MIRSMTGFGRAEGVVKDRKVTVEVRSLNSKQLDLQLKLPGAFREKDSEMRSWAGGTVVRGKCDITVSSTGGGGDKRITFDRELIAAYHTELRGIVQQIDQRSDTDLMGFVLRLPDVTSTTAEVVDEAAWEAIMGIAREAMEGFDGFRQAEGEKLHADLAGRAKRIAGLLDEVEPLDLGRSERSRERLRAKLAELEARVDQDRFEQELVYILEKFDINEEKVRLRTHCNYFLETLENETQQGRKLGFICQEMGREINTLGSKANDAAIQRLVVLMKDELEKMKEQVLNVL